MLAGLYADMPGVLEKALKLADWKGFDARRAKSKAAGKLRGIGISTVIENTGLSDPETGQALTASFMDWRQDD